MTILTAYYHLDLDNASIWDGDVTVADATHIQIKNSTDEQNYYGTFTFDTSGYLHQWDHYFDRLFTNPAQEKYTILRMEITMR